MQIDELKNSDDMHWFNAVQLLQAAAKADILKKETITVYTVISMKNGQEYVLRTEESALAEDLRKNKEGQRALIEMLKERGDDTDYFEEFSMEPPELSDLPDFGQIQYDQPTLKASVDIEKYLQSLGNISKTEEELHRRMLSFANKAYDIDFLEYQLNELGYDIEAMRKYYK